MTPPQRLTFMRALLVVVALGPAACGGGEPGSSDTVPREVPSAAELIEQFGVTPAELEDLQWIADEEGWTLEEALYRVAWQQEFSSFVSELREAYPDDFSAGGILGEEGPRTVFLAFRGPVPEEVRGDPRLDHLDVEFREATGFSEAELAEQVMDVHYTLFDLGFSQIVSGPEIADGTVRVDAARRPIDRGKTDEEILATLPANARADNVVIVFHPEGTVLGALE